jgi:hypothetical protein
MALGFASNGGDQRRWVVLTGARVRSAAAALVWTTARFWRSPEMMKRWMRCSEMRGCRM